MRALSPIDVIAVWVIGAILFVTVILHFQDYSQKVDQFADSSGYISIAAAIQKWDFHGLVVKQFWGVSYVTALVSSITRLSDRTSLLIVCWVSSFVSVWLASRLWGTWVAAFFAILNFDWLQRSYLGGSEPLFVAFLFGSFLLIRKDKWEWAALLASMATVVRPLGILALVAIGIILVQRKDYSRLLRAIVIGLVIGFLYILPLKLYLGDSLATVHSYQGSQRSLFGFPFYAIVEGTFKNHPPFTNLILSYGWIAFVLAGFAVLLTSDSTALYRRTRPAEVIFAVSYLFVILCYNYPNWALGNFARFAIPIVTFAILGFESLIPKSRLLLYSAATVLPILAAASAIGIRNIAPALR
jgi:hypothetical protein